MEDGHIPAFAGACPPLVVALHRVDVVNAAAMTH